MLAQVVISFTARKNRKLSPNSELDKTKKLRDENELELDLPIREPN